MVTGTPYYYKCNLMLVLPCFRSTPVVGTMMEGSGAGVIDWIWRRGDTSEQYSLGLFGLGLDCDFRWVCW